jgi:hypothetical protein
MWFIVGMAVSAAVIALVLILRQRSISIRWYEWALAGAGALLLVFALQNYLATSAEHWGTGTSLTFLLVFGLPAIGFILLAAFLAGWRSYRARVPVDSGDE